MRAKYCIFDSVNFEFKSYDCEVYNYSYWKNKLISFHYTIPKLGIKDYFYINKFRNINMFRYSTSRELYVGIFEKLQVAINEYNRIKYSNLYK